MEELSILIWEEISPIKVTLFSSKDQMQKAVTVRGGSDGETMKSYCLYNLQVNLSLLFGFVTWEY